MFHFQLISSRVCFSNQKMNNLVEKFQEKIVQFSHDIENELKKVVESEKTEDEEIQKLAKVFKSSLFNQYTEFLERKVNLVNTFFSLADSIR